MNYSFFPYVSLAFPIPNPISFHPFHPFLHVLHIYIAEDEEEYQKKDMEQTNNINNETTDYSVIAIKAAQQIPNVRKSTILNACEHFVRNQLDAKLFSLLEPDLQSKWLLYTKLPPKQ